MKKFILTYVNTLEGYKTAIKSLHWNAKNLSQHKLCDDIADDIADFQDTVSEVEQSINGHLPFNQLKGKTYKVTNLKKFLIDVILSTKSFYKKLQRRGDDYIGLRSECETFITKMQRSSYLVDFTIKEDFKRNFSQMITEGEKFDSDSEGTDYEELLNDAIEALEMSDGSIEYLEWSASFEYDNDTNKLIDVWNNACQQTGYDYLKEDNNSYMVDSDDLKNSVHEALHRVLKQKLNEVSTNKKLGGFVKGHQDLENLEKMRDNGQKYYKADNGRTYDVNNQIERRKRQLDTFNTGASQDFAMMHDPRIKERYDKLLQYKKQLEYKLQNLSPSDIGDNQYIKQELQRVNKYITSMQRDKHGYNIAKNSGRNYTISSPFGHAFSSDESNGLSYNSQNNQRTSSKYMNRLADMQDHTDAMMGYDEELTGGMEQKMKDLQRRQKNVRALRDYDKDMDDYNEQNHQIQNAQRNYDNQPFFKRMFNKRPENNLVKPTRPTWEPNEKGEFDGYFAHSNPDDYDIDMENTRQMKNKYTDAYNRHK